MTSRNAVRRSVPRDALPDFTPVPRKCPRHDGWTPERQRAFIAALADTGCVKVAARMVNMAHASVYELRRQPGAESFRAAWDAAQALGLQVVKDEAFDRAMHGQLVPVFVGGKLMGFRRVKNDRMLMFILRHYGQDALGRKTTVNYFSTRATAGAAAAPPSPLRGEGDSRSERGEGESGAIAAAEASTTTVKTVISGGSSAPAQLAADHEAANLLNAFEGVALDAEAQAEIYRTLEACAERRRALSATRSMTPNAASSARRKPMAISASSRAAWRTTGSSTGRGPVLSKVEGASIDGKASAKAARPPRSTAWSRRSRRGGRSSPRGARRRKGRNPPPRSGPRWAGSSACRRRPERR